MVNAQNLKGNFDAPLHSVSTYVSRKHTNHLIRKNYTIHAFLELAIIIVLLQFTLKTPTIVIHVNIMYIIYSISSHTTFMVHNNLKFLGFSD